MTRVITSDALRLCPYSAEFQVILQPRELIRLIADFEVFVPNRETRLSRNIYAVSRKCVQSNRRPIIKLMKNGRRRRRKLIRNTNEAIMMSYRKGMPHLVRDKGSGSRVEVLFGDRISVFSTYIKWLQQQRKHLHRVLVEIFLEYT